MKDRIYFKTRPRFGRAHPYDIGRPLFWWKGHYDVHYLGRLYERSRQEFADFYAYHLGFFLENNEDADEQEYFRQLGDIAGDELDRLIKDDKRESKSKHRRILQRKKHLRAFLDYLGTVDRWNGSMTKDGIIADKESEIRELKETIGELTQQLKEARRLDTDGYINIPEGYLLSVVDLMVKLRKQQLKDGHELVFSQFATVWVKMICRYFRENHQPISPSTVQRYFPADLNEMGSKYAEVPSKNRLFDVVPAKRRR